LPAPFAYPKFTPVPSKEESLWNAYGGDPCPCGLQKVLPVQSQAYREEYGFNSIYLLPVNLNGLFSEIMGMKL
jgi:GDP-L-fucose synthase